MAEFTLGVVNQVLENRIVGGSRYLWNTYGSNARYLEYALLDTDGDDQEPTESSSSVVYDTRTRVIYEWETVVDGVPYKWINPGSIESHENAYQVRGFDQNIAWDDTYYENVSWNQMIELIHNYNKTTPQVEVELEFSQDVYQMLVEYSHKHDLTINEAVNNLLGMIVEKYSLESSSTNDSN